MQTPMPAPAPAAPRSAGVAVGEVQPEALSAGERYTWIDARCVDGSLDLAQVGFQRELFLEQDGDGRLSLTFQTTLERDGCSSLMVWEASADPALDGQGYRVRAWPAVALPAGKDCGVDEHGKRIMRLQQEGDILTLSAERSAFCRGFDVFFRFKRTADRALSPQDLILRYIAEFNRQDAQAVAALFTPGAVLSEPFSPVTRGSLSEHRGRSAIFSWHADAFASNHWSAMRLLSLASGPAADDWRLRWEYMDNLLTEPLAGTMRLRLGAQGIERADLSVSGALGTVQ